jgi:hypothetical protein
LDKPPKNLVSRSLIAIIDKWYVAEYSLPFPNLPMPLILIAKGRLNRVAQEDVHIACVDENFISITRL